MDADELAEILLELRERTAGDDEAYDLAVERLARSLGGREADAGDAS